MNHEDINQSDMGTNSINSITTGGYITSGYEMRIRKNETTTNSATTTHAARSKHMLIIQYQDRETNEITEANVFNNKQVFATLREQHGDDWTFWQRYIVLDNLTSRYVSEELSFQEKLYIHQNRDQFRYDCDACDLVGQNLFRAISIQHDVERVLALWTYRYVNSDAMMQEFDSIEQLTKAVAQYVIEQLS